MSENIRFHYFIIVLQSLRNYYAKRLDTSEEGLHSLVLVNPVVGSDDEDDDTFKPRKNFLNTFVNQWCVKKDKNIIKPAFTFHAFPKIPNKNKKITLSTLPRN